MKKFAFLPVLLILVCLFTACGTTTYESNDYHFTVEFPEDMAVYIAGQTPEEESVFSEYGVTADQLTSFGQQGGVFYAVGKNQDTGITRYVTAMVEENTTAAAVWQLQENTAEFDEFEQDKIETFNVNGLEVLHSWEFTQGKMHCLSLGLSTGKYEEMDVMYMATIYNGLQYSMLYEADGPITPEVEEECDNIFYSFYINQTLANPDEEANDNTALKAVLVILLILIGILLVLIPIRLFSRRKPHDEQEPYVPQFENELKNTRNKKGE